MIRARLRLAPALAAALLVLAGACGQKGDLRLPPAKAQPAPQPQPDTPPAAPASSR